MIGVMQDNLMIMSALYLKPSKKATKSEDERKISWS